MKSLQTQEYELEIVAIGNEILAGQIQNTNATYISRELFNQGLFVQRHQVLPDDHHILKKYLKETLRPDKIIIATGGLGPTLDDMTKKIACELFDCDPVYHEEIAKDLERRFPKKLINIKDQATVPDRGIILKNPVGTASGFILSSEIGTLICIPGVPQEMKIMLEKEVIPYFNKLKLSKRRLSREILNFFLLSESQVDPVIRDINKKYPHLKLGIYPSQGVLSVHLISEDEKDLRLPKNLLIQEFKNHYFESKTGTLQECIHHLFIHKKLTLSTAESCTGGGISASLIQIPGASQYFKGSIISYSNDLKMSLLGVSKKTLDHFGAVSEEVVKEMAMGLIDRTQTDYGIAVSGIAGPDGGTPTKPIGTVCFSVISKNHPPKTNQIHIPGSREMVIQRSINFSLASLIKLIESIS